MFHQYFLDLSLKKAIHDDDVNQVRVCIQMGANPNAIQNGVSMLERLVRTFNTMPRKNTVDIVKVLLENGANANYESIQYKSCFFLIKGSLIHLLTSSHFFPTAVDCFLTIVQYGAKVHSSYLKYFAFFFNYNKGREGFAFYEKVLFGLMCFGYEIECRKDFSDNWLVNGILYCLQCKEVYELI